MDASQYFIFDGITHVAYTTTELLKGTIYNW